MKCKFCDKPILSDQAYAVYQYIQNHRQTTSRELAKALNTTVMTIDNVLLRLYQMNLVIRFRSKNGYYIYRKIE